MTLIPGRGASLVVAGNYFTCVLRNDSNVVCWGENSDGQLGIGSTVSATGGSASTIGNNFQVVNLGTGAHSPSFLQFQQST